MSSPTIGFVGMSHLGIVSAVAAAAKGFRVVGFDPDAVLIGALTIGELPISEPDLADTLMTDRDRLHFTADAADLSVCDVVVLSRDVPTGQGGESDIGVVETLFATMVGATRPDSVLVVLCQVPPGFTRSHAVAGRVLYYQVETLVFGQAISRALAPERFIIGCADPQARLAAAFSAYLQAFSCPILPMRYESAELAKIAINCFLVASVSTTNTLAEICEYIGAEWGEIVPALRLDRRIGQFAYLAPGLGIAGGNLERDLATVQGIAAQYGCDSRVVDSWVANSRYRSHWAFRVLAERVLRDVPHPRLAVLGLAYKQDTASVRNSPSLALLSKIPQAMQVRAYDPVVSADTAMHPAIYQASDPLDACQGATALLIMTPWAQFKTLDCQAVAAALDGRTVIDPYGCLDANACQGAGLSYYRLGSPACSETRND